MMDFMPGVVLTSRLGPKKLEVVYALLAGFRNSGTAVGQTMGVAPTDTYVAPTDTLGEPAGALRLRRPRPRRFSVPAAARKEGGWVHVRCRGRGPP